MRRPSLACRHARLGEVTPVGSPGLWNALLYRAATQRALRDPLTGTDNPIAMEQTLQREIDRSRRHRQPLSLLMLDIDHFKNVNDTHGHAAGDHVLREVAASIKQQLRNVDRVFRYGGEAFLILLSNTGRESAALVGDGRINSSLPNRQAAIDGRTLNLLPRPIAPEPTEPFAQTPTACNVPGTGTCSHSSCTRPGAALPAVPCLG